MIKTVLVHLSGTDCDSAVLAMSLQLLKPYAGHMECLRVVPDPAALIAQAAQLDMGTSMVLADTLGMIEQQGRERTERARIAMEMFCKAENIVRADAPPGPNAVSASWREQPAADEFDRIIELARFHDLVVLAGGPERSGRLPAEALGSIVVASGKPVLLAPEKPRDRPIKTVAIAWKDSPESARAVTAAMPLLAKAERIAVLSANEDDSKAKASLDCSESVVQQLRWHGLNAHGHFVIPAGRTVPNAILESAHGFNADLLVMGGYGHSRLREFVFGGFTQHILAGVGIPVLMFH